MCAKPLRIPLTNKCLYQRGGAETCALATERLLSRARHEVSYRAMQHPSNASYPLERMFVTHAYLVHGRGGVKRLKIALNVLYSLEAKSKSRRAVELVRPDIVHLHNFGHQISPSILDALEDYGIPAVMTMHDYKLACPPYRMLSDGQARERCRARTTTPFHAGQTISTVQVNYEGDYMYDGGKKGEDPGRAIDRPILVAY